MEKELKLKFAETLCKLEGKEYLEAMIAFAAAPTIQGRKPAALMSFTSYGRNTALLWKLYGSEICERFQVEFYLLKKEKDGLKVLIYRRRLLEWYVNHIRNQPFLNRMGYGFGVLLDHNLVILKRRFTELCPHEVGIFLGMPVEDVEGFIENKGKNCLMCRYWKVYENQRRAERLFDAYDKARTSMVKFLVEKHKSV